MSILTLVVQEGNESNLCFMIEDKMYIFILKKNLFLINDKRLILSLMFFLP